MEDSGTRAFRRLNVGAPSLLRLILRDRKSDTRKARDAFWVMRRTSSLLFWMKTLVRSGKTQLEAALIIVSSETSWFGKTANDFYVADKRQRERFAVSIRDNLYRRRNEYWARAYHDRGYRPVDRGVPAITPTPSSETRRAIIHFSDITVKDEPPSPLDWKPPNAK